MRDANAKSLGRWRLVLGRYAGKQIPRDYLDGKSLRMERALDFLYHREYAGRGMRQKPGDGRDSRRMGSLDPSQITIPKWLSEVRELFPRETIETVEKHALERYQMAELVTDQASLEKMEPSMDLLRMILSFKGHMNRDVLAAARRIVRKVVEELKEKLARDIRLAMSGKVDRFRRNPMRVAQNFDWRNTLRLNLRNYDNTRRRVIAHEVRFFSRVRRHLPWDVILCVDQSGSMLDSVIHSAVMAGILAGLPLINVKLIVFDTSIVDLSNRLDDPVEILMSVQLGGGTDIGQAMVYCERLIHIPRRTVLVLISDFCEGASPRRLLAATRRMNEAGVKLIGLAALDSEAIPAHDEKMAERLADLGMEIAALTPRQLAQWLMRIISR